MLPFLDFQCILPRNQAMPICWCKLRIYNIWIEFRCDLRPVEDATGLWRVKIIFSMAHTSKNIYQPRQHTISPRKCGCRAYEDGQTWGFRPQTNMGFHPAKNMISGDFTHKTKRTTWILPTKNVGFTVSPFHLQKLHTWRFVSKSWINLFINQENHGNNKLSTLNRIWSIFFPVIPTCPWRFLRCRPAIKCSTSRRGVSTSSATKLQKLEQFARSPTSRDSPLGQGQTATHKERDTLWLFNIAMV